PQDPRGIRPGVVLTQGCRGAIAPRPRLSIPRLLLLADANGPGDGVAEPDVPELDALPDRLWHRNRILRDPDCRLYRKEDEEIVEMECLVVQIGGGEQHPLDEVARSGEGARQEGQI